MLASLFLLAGLGLGVPQAAAAPPAPPPTPAPGPEIGTRLLKRLLDPKHPGLAGVLADPQGFRAQVLFSEIVTRKGQPPVLRRHGFRVDAEYLYPASAMKTLGAIAALQRARALQAKHPWLGPDTPLTFHPVFEDERLDDVDPSNRQGRQITLRQLTRRMALISSNYAFNRLYDFAGQRGVNAVAWQAGLQDTLVLHRLSQLRPLEDHRRHPAIELRGPGETVVLPAHSEGVDRLNPADLPGIAVGSAEVVDRRRVPGPKRFEDKNRMSLVDLQHMLVALVRPDIELGVPGFSALHPEDRALIVEPMHQLPGESDNPRLSEQQFDPNRFKPSRPGLLRVLPAERLRIYNKAGKAYGFRIENAYVVDQQTQRAFFLAVGIYTNANGVLNDGRYEYDTVADPFIHAVAEACARRVFKAGSRSRPRDR